MDGGEILTVKQAQARLLVLRLLRMTGSQNSSLPSNIISLTL
jgi:hypothetical protein